MSMPAKSGNVPITAWVVSCIGTSWKIKSEIRGIQADGMNQRNDYLI